MVMQWSSPAKPSTLVIFAPMALGPMLARAAATATFTFVGNTWMASAAVPASTVFSGVVISSSVNSGVLFSDAGPLWVWISAVMGWFFALAIRATVCSTSKPPTAPWGR